MTGLVWYWKVEMGVVDAVGLTKGLVGGRVGPEVDSPL